MTFSTQNLSPEIVIAARLAKFLPKGRKLLERVTGFSGKALSQAANFHTYDTLDADIISGRVKLNPQVFCALFFKLYIEARATTLVKQELVDKCYSEIKVDMDNVLVPLLPSGTPTPAPSVLVESEVTEETTESFEVVPAVAETSKEEPPKIDKRRGRRPKNIVQDVPVGTPKVIIPEPVKPIESSKPVSIGGVPLPPPPTQADLDKARGIINNGGSVINVISTPPPPQNSGNLPGYTDNDYEVVNGKRQLKDV
jgi:hypothetical protein